MGNSTVCSTSSVSGDGDGGFVFDELGGILLRYPYCRMAMMQDMTNTFLNLFSKRPPLLRFSWGAAPLTPLAFDPHVAILSSYRRVSKASPAISLSSRRCCAQTPHQTTCMLMLVCARQAAYCDPVRSAALRAYVARIFCLRAHRVLLARSSCPCSACNNPACSAYPRCWNLGIVRSYNLPVILHLIV